MKMNKYIFETKDVLNQNIKLKTSTWESHVIGEHAEREGFKGKEKFFQEIVEEPDYIYKQKSKSGKERFRYTFYGNINEEGNPKIYSVIAEDNGYHNDIVTLFESNSTKLKEDEKSEGAKIYDRRSKGED